VQQVDRHGDRRVVTATAKGVAFSLEAEAVLVATGRLPNVESLHLEAAGVATNRRGIVTDAHMRTSTPHVWAIGDVAGKYQFTHVAGEQGWIAAGRALGKRGAFHGRAVPWCTFTDPQVARVGRTEDEARRHYGRSVRALVWPFRRVDRAVTMCELECLI
jgi:pyruvate/2-oxoglutarate dehydrogenase complex dihydrolipoamide dehydrogenase (E3) component